MIALFAFIYYILFLLSFEKITYNFALKKLNVSTGIKYLIRIYIAYEFNNVSNKNNIEKNCMMLLLIYSKSKILILCH